MDNTTNPHPVPTPPLRKRSLHRLSSQLRIGSSEVSPSDHSSVFDAVPYSHSSRLSSGYLSDTDDEDGSSLAKDSLQSILSTYASPNLTNRSAGTKLFTISEQKSVPTLKTVPSNWTFQRRIVTTPPQISHNVAEARQSRAGHRRCFSVDENALQHHRGSEVSTTASLTSDSVMQSGDRPAPLRIPIRPVQPPFKPPERAQTPAGFPRWPGERDYRPNAVRQMFSGPGTATQRRLERSKANSTGYAYSDGGEILETAG
ncbi:unnamed protein product [Zymoseptoria tritici ST99CH_1A5]|uniref:Uncharacterized protein n=2 Tax=Zymoseptoria tritici TaxID=1047171 RepID=A0A2H1G5E9_ZYMTR|nr:unnamed protein product [Zymoseptoria tritici ST99CH_1E4]SMR49960.1 unnamed protein product [Zymoseptoria tritici ST99CH_3D1]SMY22661.1 unnamed protein product [Zymoseptoria tritici ST99CH_1A5]